MVEGEVHSARVRHVFGRDRHTFTETTFTASLLFRSTPDSRAHFIAGGGAGLQRVHADVDEPPFRLDWTETIRLLHGRIGAEYSPVGSTIHVLVRQTHGEFVIQVRDHGPGIPPADLPYLFQRFYRGAAGKRLRPGTGLGLWITERLLAVQDGRVWAENCQDGGARFTIAVPTNVEQFEACV